MKVQILPTVGFAAAAALVAGAAYLYSVRISRRSGGGFTIGTAAPARVERKGVTKKEKTEAEAPRPKVNVYFGSQTGTAEDFAKEVQREGNARGLDMTVVDLELFDKAKISSGTGVFLVATYGEGEPTDNGRDFHEWIVSEGEGAAVMKDLNFAVFGLGNSQYEHFNSFGKAVVHLSTPSMRTDLLSSGLYLPFALVPVLVSANVIANHPGGLPLLSAWREAASEPGAWR